MSHTRTLQIQNRLLKTLLIGTLAIAGWLACGPGNTRAEYETVRTQRLEIIDGAGMVQAVVESGESGAVLMMADQTGTERMGMAVTAQGPGFALADATGMERALLSVTEDGTGLFINDQTGKPRLSAALGKTMGAGVVLVDGAGRTRAGLGLDEARGPSLILADEQGAQLAYLP